LRMEKKELQEKLNDMEVNNLNVEKEKSQLQIDLKAVQNRLHTEKTRADNFQERMNEKVLEISKLKEIL
jgi:hypothetical protein